ncbi:hypothetical protein RHMOL_Rhmol04G0135900 [Rhododendron molle]|uniref:Uncharacterized protein n=1 Tax=Rhododendron molle TaxID=49168 RepID=A0ACC0P1A1_RHOML|nr:hypothetical protein RHMOL_Rhmol04G0135900 [Rhododendron molle]
MASSDLVARVESLDPEMSFYRREIEALNQQIGRLIGTIRTLHRAVSNLQDFAFDQLDDKEDSDSVLGRESDETAEDSEGNPNGSDDRSDGASD